MKPPGSKRLTVVLSAVAYILFGFPIWWHTTSLHRPPLPHEVIAAAAKGAETRSPLLPITLQLVVVVPSDVEWPDSLSAGAFSQSLEAAALNPQIQAIVHVSAVVNTAGVCSSDRGRVKVQRQVCTDLSAAPTAHSSSGYLQHCRQLDDWLLQQQTKAPGQSTNTAVALAAGGVAGVYTVFLLPSRPDAAGNAPLEDVTPESGSSSNEAGASLAQMIVGRHRHAWLTYSPEQAVKHPQQLVQLATAAAVQALTCCFGLHSSRAAITAAESLPVSAAGRSQLNFALLNADPSVGMRYTWDFEQFERQYMSKVADSLSPVCQVSINSQVLQYAPARTQGKWSKKHNAYVVKHSQLPFFIDSEWAVGSGGGAAKQHGTVYGTSAFRQYGSTAASSVQQHRAVLEQDQSAVLEPHVLHFLVYVPTASHTPLLLLGPKGKVQDSNSFWIPSWGGLVVLNPDEADAGDGRLQGQRRQGHDQRVTASEANSGSSNATQSHLSLDSCTRRLAVQLDDQQYHYIASVVVAQLQALFGVSVNSSSAAVGVNNGAVSVQQLPAGVAGFTSWQVDALLRQRSGFDVLEASRVLGGLSKLVLELPNLEMPDLIAQQVETALQDIELAWQHIAAGDYHEAGAAAAAARAAAEAAFLHPAVLAQLNFPESHKLGVYMPLFLPISVPLVQGLVGQMIRYVSQWRSYRAKAAAAAR